MAKVLLSAQREAAAAAEGVVAAAAAALPADAAAALRARLAEDIEALRAGERRWDEEAAVAALMRAEAAMPAEARRRLGVSLAAEAQRLLRDGGDGAKSWDDVRVASVLGAPGAVARGPAAATRAATIYAESGRGSVA
jgi:hypothetical protein